MRTWDTLEQGDTLVERPGVGSRVWVVLRADRRQVTLYNITFGYQHVMTRPYRRAGGELIDLVIGLEPVGEHTVIVKLLDLEHGEVWSVKRERGTLMAVVLHRA